MGKAVTLGAIISFIGLFLIAYGWFGTVREYSMITIGVLVLFFGVWILGVKFRQWVYRH